MHKVHHQESYPNPWHFDNEDLKLVSPDGYSRIVYKNLHEIAMGAPLGGECFLETGDNKIYNLENWFAGPPVWETSGKMIAVPVWQRLFWHGVVQRIGIVDLNAMNLKLYNKEFDVLDLRSFHEKKIYGYDSPILKTTTVYFELEREKVLTSRILRS